MRDKKHVVFFVTMMMSLMSVPLFAAPLPSLQSYTGIWNMPTARVLPDWHMRMGYGRTEPYRYYGGAIGLFNRVEVSGQFTEISSIEAFTDNNYGNYKDRAAGGRLVLFKEDALLPQIAIGAFDATGTSLFAQRYLVASKQIGRADFTIGLGQGILAGEYPRSNDVGAGEDKAFDFLTSSPDRTTKVFAGVEYQLTPNWTISAEYSPIDRENLYGFRNDAGEIVEDANDRWPINVGIKYQGDNIHAGLAVVRGDGIAGTLQVAFPLEPNAMLGWQRSEEYEPEAKVLYQAAHAENQALAKLAVDELYQQGFSMVKVVCSDEAIWVEFTNNLHLEPARTFGQLGASLQRLLPARITTFYLNLCENDQVQLSFAVPRDTFQAFMQQRLDRVGLNEYADLTLYKQANWSQFNQTEHISKVQVRRDRPFMYSVNPRLFTFLNNKEGFFKHKGVVQFDGSYRLWRGARIAGQFELTLFNQFGDLDYDKLENDAVRTDLVDYYSQNDPRLTMLAAEQHFTLPGQWQGRFAAGAFESAFAGFGGELFRLFNNGRWGIGVESQAVRKRDVDDNFKLRDDSGMEQWFYTGFVNLYAQLWPEEGVEVGLKIGRFLAGDPGVRLELRRSFKNFTVGVWYTKTDTDRFSSRENRDAESKGVFIRFPLALFKDRDRPGNLGYTFASFTRDQGQLVAQPSSLYPLNPSATPLQMGKQLDKMRRY